MIMTATIKEHFMTLPDGYKQKALHNMVNDEMLNAADRIAESLAEALWLGFVWRQSPEGYAYWRMIYHTCVSMQRYDEMINEQQP